MNDYERKTILIAPLDWGLGHATRMIPVIRFLSAEYKVIVAAPKKLQHIFDETPAKIIAFPGYNIQYYNLPLWISLLIQGPKIGLRALQTVYKTRRLIKKINPEVIIADNRPFVRSKKVKSVYITHQLSIQHDNAVIKKFLNATHRFLINRFDACWIPDTTDSFFAGKLSQGKLKISKYFIGGLSRFSTVEGKTNSEYKTVCVLSGPEPKRSQWKNEMKEMFSKEKQCLIIGAVPGKNRFVKHGNITLSSHLSDDLFANVLSNAEKIITRSGYTTIMDLYRLKLNALLTPTPGQSEQAYLADYHNGLYFHKFVSNTNKEATFHDVTNDIKSKFCSKQQILALIKNKKTNQCVPLRKNISISTK